MNAMAKSSKREVLDRCEQVMMIMLDGGEFHDVREYAQSSGDGKEPWNVSSGQLRRYMEHAWKWIVQRTEKDRGKTLARHLLGRRRWLAKAIEQGDLRTAIAIAKDLAELEGVYPAKKLVEKPKTDLLGRVEELIGSPAMKEVLANIQQWEPATLAISAPEEQEEKQA